MRSSPTPETRAKIAASLRGRHHPDDVKAKIAASLRGQKISDERRGKISLALTGRKGWIPSFEQIEKMAQGLRGKQSRRAEKLRFRDPSGKLHLVDCVTQFVRDNEDLFLENDTQWSRPKREGRCRASNGLLNLVAEHTKLTQWKGWTLHGRVGPEEISPS